MFMFVNLVVILNFYILQQMLVKFIVLISKIVLKWFIKKYSDAQSII